MTATTHDARLAVIADATIDDTAPAALCPGDRVSLYVNDFGGDTTCTIARVYTDAAGTEVAEVELHNGRIFTQATRFLTAVSAR